MEIIKLDNVLMENKKEKKLNTMKLEKLIGKSIINMENKKEKKLDTMKME